uniref:hypothetical protein n=1 Tax=Yoonia sp. TaxID=2212373 RepID=UPI0040480B15
MKYPETKLEIKGFGLLFSLSLFFLSMVLSSFITLTSPFSFVYFVSLWCAIIYLFHRVEFNYFLNAYLINSVVVIIFYLIQIDVYPDSYGTTHMLGAWTDDSFFFALAADEIPGDLYVRDNYWLYNSYFSQFLNLITPYKISHPVDIIFFMPGVSATLAVFTRRVALLWTGDIRIARVAYWLSIFSPVYWMLGGAILIRDTFTAAIFVYTAYCLQKKQYLGGTLALLALFGLRPASGLLALATYIIIFWHSLVTYRRILWVLLLVGGSVAGLITLYIDPIMTYVVNSLSGTSEGGAISLYARELITDKGQNGGEKIMIGIQELPYLVKLVLNGGYVFLFPFFSLDGFTFKDHSDVRLFLLSGLAPIMTIWTNAWFLKGCLAKTPQFQLHRSVLASYLFGLLVIGTYSMMGRHTATFMPLYYIICAYGFSKRDISIALPSYGVSIVLFVFQVIR